MKLSKVLLEGSYAVVAYFKFVCDLEATKIIPMTTKNVAEFTTLLSALKKAHSLKLHRLLRVTDITLVANFVKGCARISQPHLASLLLEIKQLLLSFDCVYVSHVRSHKNVSTENKIADLLCTWSIKSNASASFTGVFLPRSALHHP
jgi:ribonuclease HI